MPDFVPETVDPEESEESQLERKRIKEATGERVKQLARTLR